MLTKILLLLATLGLDTASTSSLSKAEHDLLKEVNIEANQIEYASDREVWGRNEYWASPQETLSQGRGDCEDIAIVKYFRLIEEGFDDTRLRLTYIYVQNLLNDRLHIVLEYHKHGSIFVLDSITDDIYLASNQYRKRSIMSFNTNKLYIKGTTFNLSERKMSQWKKVINKVNGK